MEARGSGARGERNNGIKKGKTFGALQTPDICEQQKQATAAEICS
jgi:hypothetical protein